MQNRHSIGSPTTLCEALQRPAVVALGVALATVVLGVYEFRPRGAGSAGVATTPQPQAGPAAKAGGAKQGETVAARVAPQQASTPTPSAAPWAPAPQPQPGAEPPRPAPAARAAPAPAAVPPTPARTRPWTATAANVATWKLKAAQRLSGGLNDVAVSPAGTTVVATGGRDGSIHLLDAGTLKVRARSV